MEDYFLGHKRKIIYKSDKSTVTKFRSMYLKFPAPPKAKETRVKMMNNIFPQMAL